MPTDSDAVGTRYVRDTIERPRRDDLDHDADDDRVDDLDWADDDSKDDVEDDDRRVGFGDDDLE